MILKKISRKSILKAFPKFPISNNLAEVLIYPKVNSNFVLTLQAKSARTHTRHLSNELMGLCKNLGISELIFFGDSKTAWLHQYNEYKPALAAYHFLMENDISKRFNGGLEIPGKDLASFFYHFIWLTRCNASLPYFYFSDKNQNFLGHICQYGNIHVDILDMKIEADLQQSIEKSDFEYFNGQNCYNQFSKFSRVPGREIVI